MRGVGWRWRLEAWFGSERSLRAALISKIPGSLHEILVTAFRHNDIHHHSGRRRNGVTPCPIRANLAIGVRDGRCIGLRVDDTGAASSSDFPQAAIGTVPPLRRAATWDGLRATRPAKVIGPAEVIDVAKVIPSGGAGAGSHRRRCQRLLAPPHDHRRKAKCTC